MYRAYLARRQHHEGATAAGLWRLAQPAHVTPSCIGPTSRGGTGMRGSTQLDFAGWPSQPSWLPHVSDLPREEAPAGEGHHSWSSTVGSASPRDSPMYRAYPAGRQPAQGGLPPCSGLTLRGGTGMREVTAAGCRRPPQAARVARQPARPLASSRTDPHLVHAHLAYRVPRTHDPGYLAHIPGQDP